MPFPDHFAGCDKTRGSTAGVDVYMPFLNKWRTKYSFREHMVSEIIAFNARHLKKGD